MALLTLLLIASAGRSDGHAQRYLSRTTRRTFNIPLVAATAVTVVLALGAGGVLLAQRAHLRAAEADGSTPVALLAEARILALRERGDEALTLAARGSGGAYEDDFGTVSARLGGANGLLAAAGKAVDGDARRGRAVGHGRTRGVRRGAHEGPRDWTTAATTTARSTLAIGPRDVGDVHRPHRRHRARAGEPQGRVHRRDRPAGRGPRAC